jgi:hypothetical protein
MKSRHISTAIGIGLLVSAISSQAAEPSPMIENLKPLHWVIGNWEGQFQDPTLGPVQVKGTGRADTGGTTIDQRWENLKNGQLFYTAHVIYFWHAETKSPRYLFFDSEGAHSVGFLAKSTANEWIWHVSGYDKDTKPTSAIVRGTFEGNNKWTLHYTAQFTAGEPQPDWEITLKRATGAGTDKK